MISLKKVFFLVLASIIASSVISAVTVMSTLSIAILPTEIKDNAEDRILTTTTIQARQLASQLGRTESVINAMATFAEQIWTDDSIPEVASFYHDENVLTPPPDVYHDKAYDRSLSKLYSGYKIAASAFDEDYQDTYVTTFEETENPLLHVNDSIKTAINRSAKMDIIFRQLYESYPEHVWLYMGFEYGFHRSFPWHGPYSRSYDPRIRPWYIGAVTGAKDVVVIMDVSGSMEGAPLANTKTAMKSVLKTLGPRDRFTVLTFSSSVSNWENTLQIASPSNVELASSHIDDRDAGGGTNINEALLEGLDILEKDSSSDRTPVLIFMTDGEATYGTTDPDSILLNVASANTIDARIFVFGLGDPGILDYQLLNDIGNQNKGATVFVLESEDLEEAMNLYYKFFTAQTDNAISWSWPYVDASGWGIIITVSKTVIVNGSLLGVVGADLTLNALIDALDDFKPSLNGYNFIFDSGGTTVIHPSFLDMPVGDWQEAEIRVPIVTFETSENSFNKLVEAANLGESSVGTVSYSGEIRVVAMVPIGDTSMRLGSVAPLTEFLDPTTIAKLKKISDESLIWLAGCILTGSMAAMVLIVKFKEDFQ